MESLATVVIIFVVVIILAVLAIFVVTGINIYRVHRRIKANSENFGRSFRNQNSHRPF